MCDNFSIGLPFNEKGQYAIADLLSDAANELRKRERREPLRISELFLKTPYTSRTGPHLIVEYQYLAYEEIKLQDNKMAHGSRLKRLDVSYTINPGTKPFINCLAFQMSRGAFQADSIVLLEETANSAEFKNTTCIDLFYHEYLGPDGFKHPFVRAYISRLSLEE